LANIGFDPKNNPKVS